MTRSQLRVRIYCINNTQEMYHFSHQYLLAMEPQGEREFDHFVNIGHNHWTTLSTVGCQPGHINVYDSLHMGLSCDVKELIADLVT